MKKNQTRNLVVTLALAMVVLVLARHLIRRGSLFGPGRQAATEHALPLAPKLDDATRAKLLAAARAALENPSEIAQQPPRRPKAMAMVSLGRPEEPALVARGEGGDLEAAVRAAAARLAGRSPAGPLKIDLPVWQGERESFDEKGRARLDRSLEGLWLPASDLLLLPEELLSRRLVQTDGDLQSGRLRDYLAETGRGDLVPEDNPGRAGKPYVRVRFESFAEGADGRAVALYRGNPQHPELTPEALLEAARQGGEYLLRHQHPDGLFDYSYEAKTDQLGEDYNLLRHAGTCYALLELYQATEDERFLAAARRGLENLLGNARPPRDEDTAAGFEAIVSPGEEAKLGGAALAILALTEYQRATGDGHWAGRATTLARFLRFQQEPSGRFRSKYFYGTPDPEPFDSIYYPGEAILALLRLHRLEPRPEWLETARRGADWLIDVRDAGKETRELPHDHWLLMGLDELYAATGDGRYLEHARRIAQAIVEARRTEPEPPDWVGSYYDPPRSTPVATRAEGLVAMHRLARRTGLDPAPYRVALLGMAAFQLKTQLRPESALYLPRPDRAVGGFRRSLTTWEVRIDYVQHNVSALLGLRVLLLDASGR